MTTQTFIAFDVDGSQIPILAADDVKRQIKFHVSASGCDFRNNGFVRARQLRGVNEWAVNEWVISMAHHALTYSGDDKDLVELLGLVYPRHDAD